MITEYAAYTCEGDSITLYRLYGNGPVVEIPGQIDGKPVGKLADHIFAGEMSVMCPPEKMSLAGMEGERWVRLSGEESPSEIREMEKMALCADRVEVICIPEGVFQIGNYAFYGLYSLREVSFPSSMQRIGFGMFNGCRKIERLIFHLPKNGEGQVRDHLTPPILKEVVDALSNEFDAVVMTGTREQYRLRFPEYYEEGKENTPARIIEIIYHGTGHQYRNCFLSRVLQFDRYDEVFPLARAQESIQTNVPLILNRLRSGPEPASGALVRYLDYLRSNSEAMMGLILSDEEFDPAQTLLMLDRYDYFTSNIIDILIRKASGTGCVPAVSCLMDIRGRRFSGRKRSRYEL